MQKNNEKNSNNDALTIQQFEYELAQWVDSFSGYFEMIPKAQQLLHNCILDIDSQIYTESEKEVVGAFLNSALSLSFLVKDNKENLQKYIDYKVEN